MKKNAVRAAKKINIPVVITREEIAKEINMMGGTTQLAVKHMYGINSLGLNLQSSILDSENLKQGCSAFLEKRKPNFREK